MKDKPRLGAIGLLPQMPVFVLDVGLVGEDEVNGPVDQEEVDRQIEQEEEVVEATTLPSTDSLELNVCQHGLTSLEP